MCVLVCVCMYSGDADLRDRPNERAGEIELLLWPPTIMGHYKYTAPYSFSLNLLDRGTDWCCPGSDSSYHADLALYHPLWTVNWVHPWNLCVLTAHREDTAEHKERRVFEYAVYTPIITEVQTICTSSLTFSTSKSTLRLTLSNFT